MWNTPFENLSDYDFASSTFCASGQLLGGSFGMCNPDDENVAGSSGELDVEATQSAQLPRPLVTTGTQYLTLDVRDVVEPPAQASGMTRSNFKRGREGESLAALKDRLTAPGRLEHQQFEWLCAHAHLIYTRKGKIYVVFNRGGEIFSAINNIKSEVIRLKEDKGINPGELHLCCNMGGTISHSQLS